MLYVLWLLKERRLPNSWRDVRRVWGSGEWGPRAGLVLWPVLVLLVLSRCFGV